MKLYLFDEYQLLDLTKNFTEWDIFTLSERKEILVSVLKSIKPKVFEGKEAEQLLEAIRDSGIGES